MEFNQLDKIEEILGLLQEIVLNSQEQSEMLNTFINKQNLSKDELINKLHKELEYYKSNDEDKYLKQLMKSIIKIRKDMKRLMNSINWENITIETLKKEYSYIFDDLSDLLEQQNIDEYFSCFGDSFDAVKHVAKIEQTDNHCLDKTIKESLNEGYTKDGKILIPERVVVYRYRDREDKK